MTTKQETVEEDVKFNTIEKDDSSMNQGESKVVTEGVNGKDKVTYEITYIDGVESERKEVSRETVTAAVDKVIANGTKISFDGKSYSRKRNLPGSCTRIIKTSSPSKNSSSFSV